MQFNNIGSSVDILIVLLTGIVTEKMCRYLMLVDNPPVEI
jgi:hypothetical protein